MNKRIDQIKARLAKSTPGKWYVSYLDDSHHMNLVAVTTKPVEDHLALPYHDSDKSIRDSIVATTLEQADFEPTKPYVKVDVDECDGVDFTKGGRWDEDAEFIAEAKDDIEYLIGEIEKRDKKLNQVENYFSAMPFCIDEVIPDWYDD